MKKVCFKVLFLLVITSMLLFAMSMMTWAHPVNGDEFSLSQPDGTKVSVKVYGDEFYQRVESMDGYTLIRNSKDYICYATLDPSGEFIATNEIYRGIRLTEEREKALGIYKGLFQKPDNIRKKVNRKKTENRIFNAEPVPTPQLEGWSQATAPVLAPPPVMSTAAPSTVKGLVILIDFPDKKSDVAQNLIQDGINKPGIGSIYDHFYDISGGKLQFTNNVTGFYTAKYNKSHYDSGSGYAGSEELLIETLTWLKNSGFNPSGLTLDSNKNVMAVTLLYAGTPEAGWANLQDSNFHPIYQVTVQRLLYGMGTI